MRVSSTFYWGHEDAAPVYLQPSSTSAAQTLGQSEQHLNIIAQDIWKILALEKQRATLENIMNSEKRFLFFRCAVSTG